MKRMGTALCCLLFMAISWGGAVGCQSYRCSRRAQAKGFDHMQSVRLDGSDGGRYTVDVYWDRSRSVPGRHTITARIWNSKTDYNEHTFSSGHRKDLWSVSVVRRKGPDLLILSFEYQPSGGPRFLSTNTVTRTHIIGHPQIVEKTRSRIEKAIKAEQSAAADESAEP